MDNIININFKVVDNRKKIESILAKRLPSILTAMGLKAQEHAVKNIVNFGYSDTGKAKGSITKTVVGDKIYVGSNLEYFPYLELGTGVHATDGNGRRGYWVYVPGEKYERKGKKKIYTLQEAVVIANMLRAKGLDAHVTNGIRPSHAIRNAVSEHLDEYRQIVVDGLKGIRV